MNAARYVMSFAIVAVPSTAFAQKPSPRDWVSEAHHEQAEGVADALEALAKLANDAQIEHDIGARVKDVEALMRHELSTRPGQGALVRYDVFESPEGVKLLRGAPYLGVGPSPDAVLAAVRLQPVYLPPAPEGLLFDAADSGYLWIELSPSGQLLTYTISGEEASLLEHDVDKRLEGKSLLKVSGYKTLFSYNPPPGPTPQEAKARAAADAARVQQDKNRRDTQQSAVRDNEATEKGLAAGRSFRDASDHGHEPHDGGGNEHGSGNNGNQQKGGNGGGSGQDKPHRDAPDNIEHTEIGPGRLG